MSSEWAGPTVSDSSNAPIIRVRQNSRDADGGEIQRTFDTFPTDPVRFTLTIKIPLGFYY